jgi:catalase
MREQTPFANIVAGDPSSDYLREALSETMKGEDDVCFDFMIQVRSADELKAEPGLEHHVEDATTTWPDEENSYERVARITIPAPQDPEAEDVVAQCEALAFSPWHSLAAHRPLGGINRLRQQVYIESASHRRAQGYR